MILFIVKYFGDLENLSPIYYAFTINHTGKKKDFDIHGLSRINF